MVLFILKLIYLHYTFLYFSLEKIKVVRARVCTMSYRIVSHMELQNGRILNISDAFVKNTFMLHRQPMFRRLGEAFHNTLLCLRRSSSNQYMCQLYILHRNDACKQRLYKNTLLVIA